jgi:hypothetical protein
MPSPALSQLHNHASEALRITRKRFLGPPFTHLLCSQRFVKLSWNVVGSGQRIRSKILRLAALSSAHGDAVAAQLHRARTSGPSYEHTAPCERLVAPSSASRIGGSGNSHARGFPEPADGRRRRDANWHPHHSLHTTTDYSASQQRDRSFRRHGRQRQHQWTGHLRPLSNEQATHPLRDFAGTTAMTFQGAR